MSKNKVLNRKNKLLKSYGDIFITNTFTTFNLFNLLIFFALLMVKSYTNMLFMGVVILNWIISVFQEIKAKVILEKLSLLNVSKVELLNNDEYKEVDSELLIKGNVVRLVAGKQIPVDMEVLKGKAEVNEALLTGEADNILKEKGSILLAGSYLVNGELIAQVTVSKEDSYAEKISEAVKKSRFNYSKLIIQLNKLVKFTSFFILPLGALLIINGIYLLNLTIVEIIPPTAAALLGMIPKGLVLLTSLSLLLAVVRLAEKKILANELSCIETLARVDTLCLDKTGTLTLGEIVLKEVIDLKKEKLKTLMPALMYYIEDDNSTIKALKQIFPARNNFTGHLNEAFSSSRKYTSIILEGKGLYFLGAYDILFRNLNPFNLNDEQKKKRCLALAYQEDETAKTLKEAKKLQSLALFIMEDKLRDKAKEIVTFFNQEDVNIKLISGDSVESIKETALLAGVKDYEKAIDLSELSDDEVKEVAENNTIFGRVNPWQKRLLIKSLQENKHTVAMAGDGINDILALSQADCSITILSGSEAATQVAKLVLMNDDFSSLPQVILEGRRVVNNITSVASLYLVKNIFSFILIFLSLITGTSFPFIPLHLTIMGAFASGIPSFLLSLENSNKKISEDFFRQILIKALPSGLLVVLAVIFIQVIPSTWLQIKPTERNFLIIIISGFIWLILILRLVKPLTYKHVLLWLMMSIAYYGSLWLLKDYLDISSLNGPAITLLLILVVIAYPLQYLGEELIKRFN